MLSTSDTRVRCGECLGVFDALANLLDVAPDVAEVAPQSQSSDIEGDDVTAAEPHKALDVAPETELAESSNATEALDATYSEFDLFSADAGLPDIHFSDHTRDILGLHFDDVSDIDDETFSDTLFAQDATVDAQLLADRASIRHSSSDVFLGEDVGFVTDDSHHEPLIFNYQDPAADDELSAPQSGAQNTQTLHLDDPFDTPLPFNKPSTGSISRLWPLRVGLFMLVSLIAVGLYGYREREVLLSDSVLRPWFSSACELLTCELPDQVDLDAIRAVERSVVAHPTTANALIIKFGVVNQASFSQPYPVVEIRLTDRVGRLVVINQFLPSEYSQVWQKGDVLDVGKRLDIGLAVQDPGKTAISFELDFREVK